MKSIAVKIDGNEYLLKGNDEELVYRASVEVDTQIKEIRRKYKEELPAMTAAVLAALNLAEELATERERFESEKRFLMEEMSKMKDFVADYLKANVN